MAEKSARASTGAASSASASQSPSAAPGLTATGSASAPKLRSCVVCRSRKVRCDKQSPCSNCRRAGIACVVPSNDRPPRWARRLERVANSASGSAAPGSGRTASQSSAPGQNDAHTAMDRLASLEGLVKELRGQLEQAHAAAAQSHSSPETLPYGNASGAPVHQATDVRQGQAMNSASSSGLSTNFGRLVLQDERRNHFVDTGFWSRISDELEGLKRDTRGPSTGDEDTSDEEDISEKSPPATHESERTPSERHGFLFRHNLDGSSTDLHQFRPLPSQVHFLLDIFSENINLICGILHMPTVTKMLREKRTIDMSHLSPSNEALMFSIYYAAVTSMEEEDVIANFGSTTKQELNMKFRLGLEHALAKADFLVHPNLTLVQAFTIFLFLLRRHDDPRFVWMLTGLAIRMAQSIGLHRDASHFPGLSPFEVEMRRRVWWALVWVDIRASEDQASMYTIPSGSFDTRLPLNIADTDIDPDTKETPTERQALTEMSLPLVNCETAIVVRQMMAPRGPGEKPPSIDEQGALLGEVYEKLERNYLQYATESGNIVYWVGVVVHRLVIAKLRLLIYLPALFSSPNERFSDAIRDQLLTAALEVAEYNHALNSETEARHWRWAFQTYTHWYAIVYLLIEASGRRPWSPMVERAWIALHSRWLIPAAKVGDKGNAHVWLPLRKLMAKARRHREAEIKRLAQADEETLAQLETSDGSIPVPGSTGPFGPGDAKQLFRQHWRGLFSGPGGPGQTTRDAPSSTGPAETVIIPEGGYGMASPSHMLAQQAITGQNEMYPSLPLEVPVESAVPYAEGFTPLLWPGEDASGGSSVSAGGVDVPMDLDIDLDMDWNTWLESAANVEATW